MKKQLLLLTLLSIGGTFYAQQGDGGNPKSEKLSTKAHLIDHYTFQSPNLTALRAEDLINDQTKAGPWRFGYNNETNLSMDNSGTWLNLANGDKIWQIQVTCEEALTVNLTFNNVKIPAGNELYVYNPKKDFILGKFIDYHLYEGTLGTELVPGNSAIIEYYIPAKNNAVPASLTINKVTHGYRTANEFIEKAFGSSGSCNMNINCPDGAAWVDQRNSTVMLVSGSSGFCTGALINNTLNDGKPYVLTANHCYSDPTTWIFRFNWEAASCANGSNPTFQSLSGAILRSRRTPTDFCLVEITGGLVGNTVPSAYSPYFSGWDKSGVIPTSSVCVHHPSGDIKKIAFDDHPAVVSQEMGSTEANSTWTVIWDRSTTTEPGSSGSPLFDQNHRIIGQLWGGGASCSNLSSPDYYGRVSSSWEPASSTSANQLKFWLDPNNVGAEFINGYDPFGGPPVALDAGLANPQGVSGVFCSATVTPQITISNSGTNVLTSATINYGFDAVLNQTYSWTGSLNQWQSEVINLPSFALTGGAHTFNAEAVNPNGATDENLMNNVTNSSFTVVINGQTVSLDLNLDCYASETSWELLDASSTVIYSGSSYPDDNPILIEQDFCLDYGCYDFIIMDSYGDGLTNCSVPNGGPGSYTITYESAIVAELTEANAAFGFTNTQNFCVEDKTGLNEKDFASFISLYPNPANESISISTKGIVMQKVELMNIAGQVISSILVNDKLVKMDVSDLSSGVYFVKVYAEEGISTKQLVVK